MFLDAVGELEADARLDFVTDMTTVVGSLFDKDSPIKEHLGLLTDRAAGAKENGSDE